MDADQQPEQDGVFKIPEAPSPSSKPISFQLAFRKFVSPHMSETEVKSNKTAEEGDETASETQPQTSSTNREEPVPYTVPVWSGPPKISSYFLEIIKNGCIVDTVGLVDKPFYVFGRLPNCDIHMDHPSVSRHHAVCQYRAIGDDWEIGWYLYDLGSTHGSFVNKEKIPPHMHVRLKVGYVIKFAGSSRLYVLQGAEEDAEEESSLSVSKIKERASKQKLLMSLPKQAKPPTEANSSLTVADSHEEVTAAPEQINGIDWGISDDYGEDEEEDEEESSTQASFFDELQKREQFYVNDPKKALKNFFDREGQEMNFEFAEKSGSVQHRWTCTIELPVESQTGKAVFATATVTGSKKDAIAACALEACRLLDAAGVLRKSNQDSRRRKNKNWEADDFYDSDEDTFLDRTGEVERKRQKRIQREKSDSVKPETYSSLSDKLNAVQAEIERVKRHIDLLSAETQQIASSASSTTSSRDSLDDYMQRMSNCNTYQAKVEQSRLCIRLLELGKQEKRLQKLVTLVKPAQMPALRRLETDPANRFKKPVYIGSMKAPQKLRKIELPRLHHDQAAAPDGEVEEFEEEEDEGGGAEQIPKSASVKEKLTSDETYKNSSVSDEKAPVGVDKDIQEIRHDRPETCFFSDASSASADFNDGPESRGTNQNDKIYSVTLSSESLQKVHDEENDDSIVKPPSIKANTTVGNDGILEMVSDACFQKRYAYDADMGDPCDPEYASWLPPDDQSGDGRTALNEKLGY